MPMHDRIKAQITEILILVKEVGHLDNDLRTLADDHGTREGLRAIPERSRAFRKEDQASRYLERVVLDLKASQRVLAEGVDEVSR